MICPFAIDCANTSLGPTPSRIAGLMFLTSRRFPARRSKRPPVGRLGSRRPHFLCPPYETSNSTTEIFLHSFTIHFPVLDFSHGISGQTAQHVFLFSPPSSIFSDFFSSNTSSFAFFAVLVPASSPFLNQPSCVTQHSFLPF